MKGSYIFIILLILLFSQCFSYIGWNPTLGGQVTKIVLLCLSVYCMMNIKRIPRTSMTPFVLLFMILPFVSIIGSYTIHNQSVSEGYRATLFSLTYLFFFILYILRIDEQLILRTCIYFGVFWVVMEAVQQFSYPTIWFATRYDTLDKAIEIRNGIYRYNMEGREFGLILLFYSFQKYLEKPSKKYLIGIALGLIGIYLLATRQIMLASVLCLFYAMLVMHKLKITSFLGIAIIIILVYNNMDTLFGDYIEMTEKVDEDDIRLVSYSFYGLEYNKGQILPFLIGNGLNGISAYGNEISKFQDFGLFRADIGIIGMYSLYGIFYVLTVIGFFFYTIVKRKHIDIYIQMYILYMLMTSVMLHHFGYSTHHIMTICIIFYLIDCSMYRNEKGTNIYGNKVIR